MDPNITSNELKNLMEDEGIPGHCIPGLCDYILQGRSVGGFLTSAIQGDLFACFTRADDENIKRLVNYARFMVWHAPSACYGSEEKMVEWERLGGLRGIAKIHGTKDTTPTKGEG
jgi:hypothetical protein